MISIERISGRVYYNQDVSEKSSGLVDVYYSDQEYESMKNELLNQIGELKNKLPQPVEISLELSDAIKLFKEEFGEVWAYNFYVQKLPKDFRTRNSLMKAYKSLSDEEVFKIIQNGYTVKPEPILRQKIAEIIEDIQFNNNTEADEIINEIMVVIRKEGIIKDENC